MLKSAAFPRHTTVYGNNNAVINCTFFGSDGPALQYNGDNMLVHNSEFYYNDWVGLELWIFYQLTGLLVKNKFTAFTSKNWIY